MTESKATTILEEIPKEIFKTLMKRMNNDHEIAEFASELHWLAFCYLSGELTAEQTIQFEQRLAEDLEAQVALADAVSLSSSVYASIDSIEKEKVSLGRNQAAVADRSTAWRWVAVAAAGFVAIVSLWQMLPGSFSNNGIAVKSSVEDGQVENSAMGLSEVDLWDRTVQMYQSANSQGDEFEIWSRDVADEARAGGYGEEYVSGDDDLEEIADVLRVDSDLASIFSSALSSLDASGGEM